VGGSAAPGISVVMPTKNAGARLVRTLEAVQAQETAVPYDLWVVDSGSTDGTVALARQYGARVIEIPPAEYGHGRTRNLAIAACTGQYVALLVQDAIPEGVHWLSALAEALDGHPQAAGAYSCHLPHEGAGFVARQVAGYWHRYAGGRLVQSLGDPEAFAHLPLEQKQLRCTFNNVSSMVRRSVWQRLPFPEVPYAEDLAWGYAVLRAGHTIVYAPESQVRHSHERTAYYELCRACVDRRTVGDLFGEPARVLTVPQARSLLDAWRRITARDGPSADEAQTMADRLASADPTAWDLRGAYAALCGPTLWRTVLGEASPYPAEKRADWTRLAVARYEWAPQQRRLSARPGMHGTLEALRAVRDGARYGDWRNAGRALGALGSLLFHAGTWGDVASLIAVLGRKASRMEGRLERALRPGSKVALTPEEQAALFDVLWDAEEEPLRWAFARGPAEAADPVAVTLLGAREACLALARQALEQGETLDGALYADIRDYTASIAIGGRLGESLRGHPESALEDFLQARLTEVV